MREDKGGFTRAGSNLPPSRGKGREGGCPQGASLRGKGSVRWERRTVMGWRDVEKGRRDCSRSLGMSLGGEEERWVPGPRLHEGRLCARTGGEFSPPSPVYTRAGYARGQGGVFTPIPRLHEGRLCARTGGSFHPHPPSTRGQALTFAPERGGTGRRAPTRGGPTGEG